MKSNQVKISKRSRKKELAEAGRGRAFSKRNQIILLLTFLSAYKFSLPIISTEPIKRYVKLYDVTGKKYVVTDRQSFLIYNLKQTNSPLQIKTNLLNNNILPVQSSPCVNKEETQRAIRHKQ